MSIIVFPNHLRLLLTSSRTIAPVTRAKSARRKVLHTKGDKRSSTRSDPKPALGWQNTIGAEEKSGPTRNEELTDRIASQGKTRPFKQLPNERGRVSAALIATGPKDTNRLNEQAVAREPRESSGARMPWHSLRLRWHLSPLARGVDSPKLR